MYFTLSLFKFYKTKGVVFTRNVKNAKNTRNVVFVLQAKTRFVHRLLRLSRAFENSSWVSTCKEFRETYSIVRTLP